MSGSTQARSVLIKNEQTKLLANALDRASTALGASSVFRVINLVKPEGGHLDGAAAAIFVAAVHGLLFWSFVLHLAARRVLRGLR